MLLAASFPCLCMGSPKSHGSREMEGLSHKTSDSPQADCSAGLRKVLLCWTPSSANCELRLDPGTQDGQCFALVAPGRCQRAGPCLLATSQAPTRGFLMCSGIFPEVEHS